MKIVSEWQGYETVVKLLNGRIKRQQKGEEEQKFFKL